MSEENLVRQCAPTLAGIKTGTIFPAPFTSLAELTAEIRELNRILVPKGLRLLPLRYQDHTALLYLYRPAELRVDLKDQLAEALLADAGYSGKSSEQCVAYLAKRFRSGGEFPHEVGLFLSYPPQDVRGFLENHAVNYKCAGLWKVYGDEALAGQAARMRDVIREQAYDGRFFCDNAVRSEDGKLVRTENHTEVCQYYAFFFGVASPESHPELWARLRDEFGPARKQNNAYPDVAFANAFIGNYLRLELLSRERLSRQILEESIAEYLVMADMTGTLWENLPSAVHSLASCNHGFAAHIVRVLYRDVLGVYEVSPQEKRVTLRFTDCGLHRCKGSIPVGNESIDMEWTRRNDTLDCKLSLPEGYTYDLLPVSGFAVDMTVR